MRRAERKSIRKMLHSVKETLPSETVDVLETMIREVEDMAQCSGLAVVVNDIPSEEALGELKSDDNLETFMAVISNSLHQHEKFLTVLHELAHKRLFFISEYIRTKSKKKNTALLETIVDSLGAILYEIRLLEDLKLAIYTQIPDFLAGSKVANLINNIVDPKIRTIC